MTSHASAGFSRELNALFKKRTQRLRAEVAKARPGRPPVFRPSDINKGLNKLLKHTETWLLNSGSIDSMLDLYDHKKQWHARGTRLAARRKSFLAWFSKNVPHMNCVYIFWAGKKCRYVGRTRNGKSRPQNHFRKKWFAGVTKIVILSSKGGRDAPKLECLAWHRYKPAENRIRPSRRKWHSKCQICEAQKRVRGEVRSIFRLR